jgi:hypothetical protein
MKKLRLHFEEHFKLPSGGLDRYIPFEYRQRVARPFGGIKIAAKIPSTRVSSFFQALLKNTCSSQGLDDNGSNRENLPF